VVVVVAAVEEGLVDALLRLGNKAFPDRIAVLGGAEAEKAEGRVGETVNIWAVMQRAARSTRSYPLRVLSPVAR
jgi:hypothetical protein